MRHRAAKILIVDDQMANVMLLEDVLTDAGFKNIESLTDPRQVEASVVAKRPHIILLDIRMPHMDGFAVLEMLSRVFDDQLPLVMVLTAENDPAVRYKALALGAIDFLNKPFDTVEIVQRLNNLLDFDRSKRTRVTKNEDLAVLLDSKQEDISKLSMLDPVSGLLNRRGLVKEMTERFSERYRVASMVINIDGLEQVEHLHGHEVGEKLFKLVQRKCAQAVNLKHMTWGCWGGYQLVLLTSTISELQLKHFANELVSIIKQPHYLDSLMLHVSARVGICLGEDIYHQANELIRRAQLAMPTRQLDCKVRLYNNELERSILRANAISEALPSAIENNEFVLYYQPKIDLSNNKITGMEALVRWDSPTFGFVAPDEFIGGAERSGRIEALGDWVIKQSLEDLKKVLGRVPQDDFKIAINVSASQLLNPHFADNVMDAISASGVPASAVELEVTESLMIHDPKHVVEQLFILRSNGVSLALDDFGTGYSSLSYLRQLPIDVLKIDKAFVMDILEDIEAKSLIKGIINLAKIFDFMIVAEGVEKMDQATLLSKLGCNVGQGYLYSKPRPLETFIESLTPGLDFHVFAAG